MRTIDRRDYERVLRENPVYYSARRYYIQKAAEWAGEIDPRSVLELGPYRLAIVPAGDTMDRSAGLTADPTILHDATVIPWPIADGAYDLFIALQVWEHLGASQAAAFAEVRRIARAAILSFPYRWNMPGDCHHGIDESRVALWTCGALPTKVQIVGTRILYRFDFLWELP